MMMPRSIGGALTALAVLSASLVGVSTATATEAEDGLLAHYAFTETSGTAVADSTGNGLDGSVVGAATWTGASLDLPGGPSNASYVALPDGLLAGQAEATVSIEVKPDPAALSTASFLWNLGGTSETGSLFTTTNGTLRSSITPSNWSGEQNATWTGKNLVAGVWQNVTTTLASNGDGTSTMTVYVDGLQVAQNAAVTMSPADLAQHTTNRIGGSAYAGDSGFSGEVAEMRIYSAALDAAAVRSISETDAASTAAALAAALDLGDTTAVTADLTLDSTATWTTTDAAVVTAGGAVTRPAAGQPDAEATLTAMVAVRGASADRAFTVTVPALAEGETTLPPAASLAAHFPLNAAFQDASTTRTTSIGGATSVTWTEQYLDMTSGGYVANNSFSGFALTDPSVSFSFDTLVSATATGSSASTLLSYGSSATSTNISYRPFYTPTSSAAVITIDGAEVAVAQTDHAQVRDTWVNVTIVLDAQAGTLSVYENGVLAATTTGVTQTAAQLGDSVLRLNRDATTFYNVPSQFRDLKVYRTAVTADQASALARVNAQFGWDSLVASVDLGDADAVVTDLTLPGQPLATWTSSNPDVVAADGTVTPPAPGQEDIAVTLTVSLERGGTAFSRTFPLTVLAQIADGDKAAADGAALVVAGADNLRTVVTLPGTGSRYGSAITWTTSDAGTLPLVSQDGTTYADPVRPAYGHPAATATLTATLTLAGASVVVDVPVTIAALPRAVDDEGYAFAYFTADTVAGENIYLAASNGNDALSWSTLNGGAPVLTSTFGEMGLRDPFIIRSVEGDTFYLIATDLSIGRSGDWGGAQVNGSQYIEIWESTDLVNWSEQRHIKVSPDTAGMTWAPEAYYDDELDAYVVFWASRLFTDDTRTTCITTASGAGCYARMMYATTKDFVTFSDPQIWQDTGAARIDSTVIKDGDSYYRFTKDEGGQTGCTDIISEKSSSLTAVTTTASLAAGDGWESVATCIARSSGFTGAVEGPTVFKANKGDTSPYDYYLYLDNYGGSGYFPLGTDDLDSPTWTRVQGSLPSSRHGTVLPVTLNQWNSLTGRAMTTTPSTTAVSASPDGVLTATVSAADGYEVGGVVTFSDGTWSQQAYLARSGDTFVATTTLPAAAAATSTRARATSAITADFAGTPEIEASSATVEVSLPAEPSPEPTPEPSPAPTTDPSAEPTTQPTLDPTTDPTVPSAPDSADPAGPTGGTAPTTSEGALATTGAEALSWTLLALALLAAGIFLVRHRRATTVSPDQG